MPLVRLLAIVSLLCPVWSFAQAALEPPQSSTFRSTESGIGSDSSDPWRILPKLSTDDRPVINSQTRFANEYVYLTDRDGSSHIVKRSDLNEGLISEDSSMMFGAACFSIRSYVVARDSKYSDSTHLVRSSTCVPASKYKMKVVRQDDSVIHP